jgi:hypothetical protein
MAVMTTGLENSMTIKEQHFVDVCGVFNEKKQKQKTKKQKKQM